MPPAKRTADVLSRSVPRTTSPSGSRISTGVHVRRPRSMAGTRARRVVPAASSRTSPAGRTSKSVISAKVDRIWSACCRAASVHSVRRASDVSDGHGAVIRGVGAHERTAAGAAHDASAAQELDPGLEALEDRGDRAVGRTDARQVPAGERRIGWKLGPGQRQHDVIDLVTQRQDGTARRPLPGVRKAAVEGVVDAPGMRHRSRAPRRSARRRGRCPWPACRWPRSRCRRPCP